MELNLENPRQIRGKVICARTPAEACGITVEGENKWITLIQNSAKAPTLNTHTQAPKT